MVSDKMIILF